jgi:hypothetical protein
MWFKLNNYACSQRSYVRLTKVRFEDVKRMKMAHDYGQLVASDISGVEPSGSFTESYFTYFAMYSSTYCY